MRKDAFENEHIKMYLENGILHGIYQPELHITLHVAKKIVQERVKYTNGIKRPILADIRGMKHVENDARDYLASDEACQLISALAIVTGSRIQKLFANFYLIFSKPGVPTQLFTDKHKAIQWLNKYR